MSMNKIIIIFLLFLAVFIGVVFMQFRSQTENRRNTIGANTSTVKAAINDHTFTVEIAKSSDEQQLGLSGRESLAPDHGMLFLFEKPGTYSFWMKNMNFPIDIIFIKEDKVVSVIHNATPAGENQNPQLYSPEGPIDTALEINAGLAEKYKIKKGDTVKLAE